MSKYKSKKIIVDDITFDSKLELMMYEQLKEKVSKGEIKSFSLKPIYELQSPFIKNNIKYRPINYISDFLILNNDDTIYLIDTKGFQTVDSKLKKKLFDYKYPNIELKLLGYVAKYGGWLPIDEINAIRRKNKRDKIQNK
jgi:hypothetical protein